MGLYCSDQLPRFPRPEVVLAIKGLYNYGGHMENELRQRRVDDEVFVNQRVPWATAPLSLVYYFATFVGKLPPAVRSQLPTGSQDLLR